MAILAKPFGRIRRILLSIIGILLTLLILRTPTTPYYKPGTPKPTEPDNKRPRLRLPEELQKFLTWNAPQDDPDHYPPYDAYKERDYDPNRWEIFPQ